MATKTHFKKLFDSPYLGAWDVDGPDLIRTIASIGKEEITGNGGKKDNVVVCQFKEGGKPMCLNVTNCKIIAKIYGTKIIEEWIGKPIQIYATETRFGAEMVDALRIRKFPPKTGKAAEKSAILKEITTALDSLPPKVSEEWKARLKKAKAEKKDTIPNLRTVLKAIQNAI